MANGGYRPVAPVRKVIAGALGTFATFVILFGFGLPNWTIVAFGVALLVLAGAILATSAFRGVSRAWVPAMAQVQRASEAPAAGKFGRCEMQLLIQVPGLPVQSVKVREPRVPVNKWPYPGATLPVRVAVNDQRHVRILWDDVLTHEEAEAAERTEMRRSASADLPTEEILLEEEPPPWRQRDDDFLPPEEDILAPVDALTVDLTDDMTPTEPAAAHQKPGSGVVLEGQLVEPPTVVPFQRGPEAGSDLTERPTTIHGVGVTLLVADLNRSVSFYRDQLGFRKIDDGDDVAVLASGTTRLVLRAVPEVAPVTRRLVHLNLEVDDLNAVYEELKAGGIKFIYAPRAVNRGAKLEQWAATFRDPDGHGIALTQWHTRAST